MAARLLRRLCVLKGGWSGGILAVGILLPGGLSAEPGSTLASIAECLAKVRSQTNDVSAVVDFTATVTLVDVERGLVVLQDDSAALAVQTTLNGPALKPGQQVKVTGNSISKCVRAFPAYPHQPSTRGFLPSFEMSPGRGTYYLARIRGYLHPPVSGQYTFWTTADDAGELWLSPDASPERMQRITLNRPGSATGPGEWDRPLAVRSNPVDLVAGEAYYVEAMYVQSYGRDSFGVAWRGPDMARSVIAGRYLTPWNASATGAMESPGNLSPTNGLLLETWTNFFIREYDVLRMPGPFESTMRIGALKLATVQDQRLPSPQQIDADISLDAVPNLRWVELEGDINFATAGDDRIQFELQHNDSVLGVRVLNWRGQPAERLVHSHVRIRGVLEHAYGPRGEITDHALWVPDEQQVSLLEPLANQAEVSHVAICDLDPANPEMRWGRRVNVRGRIIQQTKAGLLVLQGDDNYSAFCSEDGRNWMPAGRAVEIEIKNPALVGMAIVSRHDTAQASANFSQSVGMGTNWSGARIGNPTQPGRFDIREGVLAVTGGGRKIGDRGDQLYYVSQPTQGEVEVLTHLADLVYTNANASAQAGLMIRESLDARSPFAAVIFTPDIGPTFQYRRYLGEPIIGFETRRELARFRWLKLVRRKSVLQIQGAPAPGMDTNQVMNVTGAITWQDTTPILTDACFEFVRAEDRAPQPAANQIPQSIPSFALKAQHPPEPFLAGRMSSPRLHGVVTFCGEFMGTNVMFVQSGAESGIQVTWSDVSIRPRFEVGQLVEMSGYATVRKFPVILQALDLKYEGWGTLPRPEIYSSALLKSEGAQDRWVEAAGVVRSENTNGMLTLMTKDGPLAVWVSESERAATNKYVDATLRMRGVLSLDAARNVHLLVPSAKFVEVRECAPPDPFAVPQFAISELAVLENKPERQRRMKLAGVVTCCLPQGFYVQDETGGAFVRTSEATLLRPGDRVEAVGFPENNSIVLVLSETIFRKTGTGTLPVPASVTLATNHDPKQFASKLVALEGTLLEQRNSPEEQLLSLQLGTKIIEAAHIAGKGEQLPAMPIGSRVAVRGVCQIGRSAARWEAPESETISSPALFQIWLRTPADVVLLERPSWWTVKRAAWAGGLFAGGLLGALIWVRILRRRVAQKNRELQATMNQLAKETRTSAVLAERDRLAGEIHDSLQQGLAAVMLQLDAANKQAGDSPEAQRLIRMARSMAESSRAEVEHAVWDLQSPLLDNADLGTALRHVGSLISPGTPQVTVAIAGQCRALPSAVEHHLLRIAQEAITNAVKHAQASIIELMLDYSGADFQLLIKDNGRGFIPEAVKSNAQTGHFGLHGIRSRARKIQAQLDVSSQPGRGTTIAVRLKLNHANPEAVSNNTAPP